ncbi:hypothetical protein ACHAPE_007006 [Trichoderma viride]
MAKQKLIGETPLPGEKAKLHHQVNPDGQISDAYTFDSLPLRLASFETHEKRKRAADPEPDTLEAAEIKRARKNSSEPPDPDPEQNLDPEEWPGVQDVPRKEGSDWVLRYYERSYQNYLLSEKAYNESYNEDNMPADEPNPLPSPETSDRDAAEGDERESPIASPEQERHPIPNLEHSGSEQDAGSELWPGIGYHPSEEGPKWFDERCLQSYQQFLLFERAYDEVYNEDNVPADQLNPPLGPESSNRDAAESGRWDFPAVSPDQAQHSRINPYGLYCPGVFRKRDPVPPQRKRSHSV